MREAIIFGILWSILILVLFFASGHSLRSDPPTFNDAEYNLMEEPEVHFGGPYQY